MSKEDSPVIPTLCARAAFTLVELLVVVAIVALLGALTAAAVTGAKAKARQTQCAGNLRQLGLALQLFVNEQHQYPMSRNPKSAEGPYPSHLSIWFMTLQRTASDSLDHPSTWVNKGMWDCPTANRPINWRDADGYHDYGYNDWGLGTSRDDFSYGLGGHISAQLNGNINRRPVRESDIVVPSQMIAIGDGFMGGKGIINDGVSTLRRTTSVENYLGSTARSRSRHRGLASVVFCDGHVEALSLVTLFDSKEPQALQRWNSDNQPHAEFLSP